MANDLILLYNIGNRLILVASCLHCMSISARSYFIIKLGTEKKKAC